MSGENANSIRATFSPRSDAGLAVDDLTAAGFDKKDIHVERHVSSATVTVSGGDPARLSDAAAILQRHGGKPEVLPAAPPAAKKPHHPSAETVYRTGTSVPG